MVQLESTETIGQRQIREMNWYSSKIRLACLIQGVGLTRYMDSVVLFRAKDFKGAMKRALEFGKRQEEEYLNAEKELVRWRFKEVVSLDIIEHDDLDGVEVHSDFIDSDEQVDFNVEFTPEKSKPTQTI